MFFKWKHLFCMFIVLKGFVSCRTSELEESVQFKDILIEDEVKSKQKSDYAKKNLEGFWPEINSLYKFTHLLYMPQDERNYIKCINKLYRVQKIKAFKNKMSLRNSLDLSKCFKQSKYLNKIENKLEKYININHWVNCEGLDLTDLNDRSLLQIKELNSFKFTIDTFPLLQICQKRGAKKIELIKQVDLEKKTTTENSKIFLKENIIQNLRAQDLSPCVFLRKEKDSYYVKNCELHIFKKSVQNSRLTLKMNNLVLSMNKATSPWYDEGVLEFVYKKKKIKITYSGAKNTPIVSDLNLNKRYTLSSLGLLSEFKGLKRKNLFSKYFLKKGTKDLHSHSYAHKKLATLWKKISSEIYFYQVKKDAISSCYINLLREEKIKTLKDELLLRNTFSLSDCLKKKKKYRIYDQYQMLTANNLFLRCEGLDLSFLDGKKIKDLSGLDKKNPRVEDICLQKRARKIEFLKQKRSYIIKSINSDLDSKIESSQVDRKKILSSSYSRGGLLENKSRNDFASCELIKKPTGRYSIKECTSNKQNELLAENMTIRWSDVSLPTNLKDPWYEKGLLKINLNGKKIRVSYNGSKNTPVISDLSLKKKYIIGSSGELKPFKQE